MSRYGYAQSTPPKAPTAATVRASPSGAPASGASGAFTQRWFGWMGTLVDWSIRLLLLVFLALLVAVVVSLILAWRQHQLTASTLPGNGKGGLGRQPAWHICGGCKWRFRCRCCPAAPQQLGALSNSAGPGTKNTPAAANATAAASGTNAAAPPKAPMAANASIKTTRSISSQPRPVSRHKKSEAAGGASSLGRLPWQRAAVPVAGYRRRTVFVGDVPIDVADTAPQCCQCNVNGVAQHYCSFACYRKLSQLQQPGHSIKPDRPVHPRGPRALVTTRVRTA